MEQANLAAGIEYRRVDPVGTRPAIGTMECGCSHEVFVPVYPEEDRGAELRDLRVALGLGLREACTLLGLSALNYSLLERGGAICCWDEAARRLRLGSAVL